eukprot:gnl/TRDRNA2_/TRDRNA2_165535_c0_seq1.p1 gnl/TRDRNA2_/TRDRNA2_165535_c0~~gnl/TRDRNA2_/TRDRNA2_165535_c0_seq1.p1  ORF type:complete len:390 (-),score=51.97 gnl/TRDRNA2_/TRDRNA2_165535_c0_seq1:19-1188(-)
MSRLARVGSGDSMSRLARVGSGDSISRLGRVGSGELRRVNSGELNSGEFGRAYSAESVSRVESVAAEPEPQVLQVLRAQVEQLARELSRAPGAKAEPVSIPTSPALHVAPASTPAQGSKESRPAAGEGGPKAAVCDEIKEDDEFADLAGMDGNRHASWGTLARGIGRGKPVDGQQVWWEANDSIGRGVGRGRPLAAPPGLQAPQVQRSLQVPTSLAKFWKPGPPIPEEDAGAREDAMPDCELPDLSLPSTAFGDWNHGWDLRGGVQTPSHWSKPSNRPSVVNTPSVYWAETPSPPGTPRWDADRCHPGRWTGLPPAAISGPVSGGGGAGGGGSNAPLPMYVTVPLAVANCCPHCGALFATSQPAAPASDTSGRPVPAADAEPAAAGTSS